MTKLMAAMLLALLGVGCSANPGTGPSGPPPGAPQCGVPQLPTLVDSEECRSIEGAWRSEFKANDLHCDSDADCVEVAGDECDIVVVSKRAAERAKELKPLCFKPLDSAGMCARPTATCEGGCCAALL